MIDTKISKWEFYDALIREIPENVRVHDACAGLHWSYVEAEHADGHLTMGISYTMHGGGISRMDGPITGRSLREVAELSKSWNWVDATIGIAALNAWYSTFENVSALGGIFEEAEEKITSMDKDGLNCPGCSVRGDNRREYRAEKTDPFNFLKIDYTGKKITVIGHFPWLDKVAEVAELTILERNPHAAAGDTPDPGCEYIIPTQDYVLMTGVTLINKTAPRLIELAKDAVCVMIGPSVTAATQVFDYGVEIIAGRIVVDHERAKEAVKQSTRFASSLKMYSIDKRQHP